MRKKKRVSAFQNIKNYQNPFRNERERANPNLEFSEHVFGAFPVPRPGRAPFIKYKGILPKILKFQSNVTFSLLDRF